MGRRALRKIDPNLDVAPYLRTLDELSHSWTPEDWFERPAPLEIDIGSGKGLFLANASTERPDHNFLGIEIISKYARFTAARLAKQNATNARILYGDARQLLHQWLSANSTLAVHVYFPDPWWKKRHKRRRVMNSDFVGNVERVLVAGGKIHFWTDVEEYFYSTVELIQEHSTLTGPYEVAFRAPQHALDYQTHFERRMRLEGEQVFRAEFVK